MWREVLMPSIRDFWLCRFFVTQQDDDKMFMHTPVSIKRVDNSVAKGMLDCLCANTHCACVMVMAIKWFSSLTLLGSRASSTRPPRTPAVHSSSEVLLTQMTQSHYVIEPISWWAGFWMTNLDVCFVFHGIFCFPFWERLVTNTTIPTNGREREGYG